eukprot:scaffold126884_cov23-Tisochrysis_lutea.AAC.1
MPTITLLDSSTDPEATAVALERRRNALMVRSCQPKGKDGKKPHSRKQCKWKCHAPTYTVCRSSQYSNLRKNFAKGYSE